MEVNSQVEGTSESATLVARILSGDRSAEAELVDRYSRGISLVLKRATAQAAVAEDLLQDTFRLAIEKIRRGELRDAEKLPGFICNIARNLAIDYYRRHARHEKLERELDSDAASATPDPLEQLLAAEKAAIVRKILRELRPERDREILYRFYIAEQDKDRICRDLELTSLHFNRVLFRARERYRELYDKLMQKRRG